MGPIDAGRKRSTRTLDDSGPKGFLRPVILIAALLIVALSNRATAQPATAAKQPAAASEASPGVTTSSPQDSPIETGNGLPADPEKNAAGQTVPPPDSLQSCCDWNAVTAFLSSAKGDGSRTMAQTLYVLSAQDALKAVNDALKAQKRHLSERKSGPKKGEHLMSLGNSLRTSGGDLRAEIKALSNESIPDKDELLKNMKNTLEVVQQDLAINGRILGGKAPTPVLLGKIAHLDRLLAQVSEDCRKYLSGEK